MESTKIWLFLKELAQAMFSRSQRGCCQAGMCQWLGGQYLDYPYIVNAGALPGTFRYKWLLWKTWVLRVLKNSGERNSLSSFVQNKGQWWMRKTWEEKSWNKKQSWSWKQRESKHDFCGLAPYLTVWITMISAYSSLYMKLVWWIWTHSDGSHNVVIMKYVTSNRVWGFLWL